MTGRKNGRNDLFYRHCEERSDEAILYVITGTQDCRALRARNDGGIDCRGLKAATPSARSFASPQ